MSAAPVHYRRPSPPATTRRAPWHRRWLCRALRGLWTCGPLEEWPGYHCFHYECVGCGRRWTVWG